ncbi:hypothetical protein CMV_029275 [Castanea mollissima]|uniref:NAB domain-containing protein n=1 Tax=Castanea mollissima TaxID=60419 RepID=A0A8J4Q3E3_9ROSI|nr:hypothetical protein CMV_029275 [Castanea mollissima]
MYWCPIKQVQEVRGFCYWYKDQAFAKSKPVALLFLAGVMATLLHSDSRRLYSWWWDSHISPKNSKWLQENLTDMDVKVKAMIKLIEEDADSFARRAEMYYKKRPELMKLVEEFYRAYRALAERYDHATVELRQAHRTMAEVFPNQVPYVLADDSPSGSSGPEVDPHIPEMPHPIRALLDPDDLHKDALGLSSTSLQTMKRNGERSEEFDTGISKRGLKQFNEMFGSRELVAQNSNVAEGRMRKDPKVHEAEESERNLQHGFFSKSQHAGEAEREVETLKKTLAEIQVEKEAILLQYKQSLEKLSHLERELNQAQRDAGGLDERASKAEIEIKILKEALVELEAERDAGLLQYNQSLERISSLENMLSVAQDEAKGLNVRAVKAETEAQCFNQELSRLEAEKEAGLLHYKQCLEKISVLETKISLAEENARMLNEQIERAETEVKELKKALTKLNEEKESAAFQYKQCLEIIEKMERELFHAQEDAKRLNRELLKGAAKLKSAEEQCFQLERSNQSLQLEADNLVQKIVVKDQELSEKHGELEKLQTLMHEEHSRFEQVEATLQTLQKLHSQSQEEQRALALELKNGLQMFKDLEISKRGMDEQMQRVKEENRSLNEINFSSTVSINNLQNEIFILKLMKEKLEEEVTLKADQSNVLQQEIWHLKEEIKGLNGRYQAIIEQVASVGLNPECLESSVKDLQDENSNLKEVCEREKDEREALHEKLKHMDEVSKENAVLESSLSGLMAELEGLREKVGNLQESCQFLQGEKSTLVSEKATLFSQLQIVTENLQKLLEKNTLLENSLSSANMELEGLRARSKSLEEACQLLGNEKSSILNERDTLVSQLENVEQRLGSLERRFTKLEEKYSDLENEKKSTFCRVEELQAYIFMEKQEHTSYVQSSEARLAGLENQVHILQQESRLGKKEFEEELDRAVNAQVEVFILQKFIEDLEEKNLSLLNQCQKKVEASKFSDKLISELESENLEQQVEVEFLLDEIQKLRMVIHQVFRAIQIDPDNGNVDKIELEHIPVPRILDGIEDLKDSLLTSKDEKQQLLVENSVLLTLLEQLKLEGAELDSEKKIIEHEFEVMTERCSMLQKNKHELLEMNMQLRSEMGKSEQREEVLKAELETLHISLATLKGACLVLQKESTMLLEEKESLLKSFSDLKEEKHILEEESRSILHEALALSNMAIVFESFAAEKSVEIEALSANIDSLHVVNIDLKEEARELSEAEQKLKASESLNVELCRTVEDLNMEHKESKLIRENLERQILQVLDDSAIQKKEIECLREVNENMESKVAILNKEIEEHRIREENLNSELQEKRDEFELWDAEAATFYFDLQISATREVLLEKKVQELAGACESLEDETAAKGMEIAQMKERVSFLESEIGGLKAQLSAYVPVIASLGDDIASLEQNALLHTKLSVAQNLETQDKEMEIHPYENSCQELKEDQRTAIPDGISHLQKMQTRIKAVEKTVMEEMERLATQESINTNIKVEDAMKETEDFKPKGKLPQERGLESQRTKPENGILMKDIPLDQVSDTSFYGRSKIDNGRADDEMLELWETAEQECGQGPMVNETQKQASAPVEDVNACHRLEDGEKSQDLPSELEIEKELGIDKLEVSASVRQPNQDVNKGKFLERLASDAQKLMSLQTTLQDLKKRVEMNKRSKKANDIEYETIKRQLQEVEEAILQLVDVNDKLTKDIEGSPSSLDKRPSVELEEAGNVRRKRATEQATKGSEKNWTFAV